MSTSINSCTSTHDRARRLLGGVEPDPDPAARPDEPLSPYDETIARLRARAVAGRTLDRVDLV
ncbi:hypothetical protein ACWDSJ_24285 [Nocardia sp. NPDC003482]